MATENLHTQLMGIHKNMLNFAMILTGNNRDDAFDLVQDTTLKVLDNSDKFSEDGNFKGWVLTIMRNIFINNYRKAANASTFVDTTEDLFHLNISSSGSVDEPEGVYTAKEITCAIDMLDKDLREPMTLLVKGYKYEEVADELSIPVGTVKTRVHNARRILQRRFAAYNYAN